MAEEIKAPVAIRVIRPFGSEEEFLEHEIDTLTRSSVVLLGAQSRPQGVILRFEVTLATGVPLLRGEGRVVAYRAASPEVDPGLTLRFTRLDARSKALVDRAASIREARARAAPAHPPHMDPEPGLATPPEPEPTAPTLSEPSPHVAPLAPRPVQTRPRSLPPPLPNRGAPPTIPPAAQPPAPVQAAPPPAAPPSPAAAQVAATAPSPAPAPIQGAPPSGPTPSIRRPDPKRREELLDRLRQRAKTLSPTDVASLLASRVNRHV